MYIEKQTFYHVSEHVHWQKGNQLFIGNDFNARYEALMNRAFVIPNDQGQIVPLNIVANGMELFIKKQEKSDFLPQQFHYNPAQTLLDVIPMIRSQLTLLRELIFEEVRVNFFPHQPSRYKALHVISSDKAALEFWLPMLKKPEAKIYQLELTGKLHCGHYESLNVNSIPPYLIRSNAYKYWGSERNSTPQDECIFEGHAVVKDIIEK